MKLHETHRLFSLDPNSADPLYRQIYTRCCASIAEGLLKPGDRLPSARALAIELGLARGTVETAYSLLTAEGYTQTRGSGGTVVSPYLLRAGLVRLPVPQADTAVASISGESQPAWKLLQPASTILPLQMGLPAMDAFPRKVWARVGARHMRAMGGLDMAYPPAHGCERLRSAIAAYLQVARGIACTSSQVFVTAGYRNSLELIVRLFLKAGDSVLVEDPGYPPARQLLANSQIVPVSVPVDSEGMQIAGRFGCDKPIGAAVVTPAHQSPLCVTMSLPRRLALLDWASQHKAWIIEDDYDGEYRYVNRPLPALKSLDRDGRVLYAGSFSKVLVPGIRLGYVVVPSTEVERFEHIVNIFSAGGPEILQLIVADFMINGHFTRHIHRMRKLYAQRRELTAAGLKSVLGRHIQIDPQPGGMHLVLRLNGGIDDTRLAERMLQDGLYAQALGNWTFEARKSPALLLSFTNVASEAVAGKLADRIFKLIQA
jgi:GntR family transcriptional regulator / MocR family aminotransferase